MLALFWCIKVYGRVGDTDHWVYCDTVQYPVLQGGGGWGTSYGGAAGGGSGSRPCLNLNQHDNSSQHWVLHHATNIVGPITHHIVLELFTI